MWACCRSLPAASPTSFPAASGSASALPGLIMEPEFIIADEPISALDVSIRAQVLNLMSRLQKERGMTYLFIAHDLSVMRFISDRIAVIHKGVIVELAETESSWPIPCTPTPEACFPPSPCPTPAGKEEGAGVRPRHARLFHEAPQWRSCARGTGFFAAPPRPSSGCRRPELLRVAIQSFTQFLPDEPLMVRPFFDFSQFIH